MTMAPSMSSNDLTSHHSKTCFNMQNKWGKKKKHEKRPIYNFQKLITKPQIYKTGSCSPCDTCRNSGRLTRE